MLRITHPEIRRGGATVLAGATLLLPRGSVTGLVGLNGAGKTSLIMALADVLAGVSDIIIGDGTPEPIGYLPQHPVLPDWLLGHEAVHLHGVEPARLVERFPELGLTRLLARRIDTLSGGERQLLSAATVLAGDARLTLLDEPFSALDVRRRRQLLDILRPRRTAPGGEITVVSSQVAGDLLETCDWFVVIRDGGYSFQGSLATLMDSPREDGRPPEPVAQDAFEDRLLELVT